MTDYKPIACGIHSEYEVAIMHRKALDLVWKDPRLGECRQTVLPVDIITRNHEEFLLVEDSAGQKLEIRLDHILHH